MKINKIEWRNFSSYGNKKQILEFPSDAGLFQVVGENGSGKTTISQVIAFGLYGKVEGKKLGDIPNRINGNAWVKIEFENAGKIITVERGLEPSIFNLYINGILYDQAGSRNIQDYLTDDLIGIPYYVFNNTISLSINDFKSFIRMSPQDKRAIIDKIFGFHILNQMRDILKGETKRIKEALDVLSGKLSSTENSITQSTNEMELLLSQIEKDSVEEISRLNKSLENFTKLQTIHSKKLESFKKDENSLLNLISTANRSLIETRSRYQELERRMKLYDADKCPTCESSLTGEFHSSIKETLGSEKITTKERLTECENSLIELRDRESAMKTQKTDIIEKGTRIELKIKEILKDIKLEEDKKGGSQVSSLERIIRKLEDDRTTFESDTFKTAEKSNWIKTLDEILGEKGVKQMAIRTILPSLNSEISDLLRDIHLDYQVIFDEEFKAALYHMGIEIPVQTLSTGEMKKVDFVVLIAIMKLMKLKFSSINLLFLDELFSSVDPDGIHSILNILKKNSKEMGLNIFVINHAPMPHEIFDWKLDVKKLNNFSSITLDQF